MRLGLFLPNWIGDVAMATPAIDSLRELAGPSGRVVAVMRPYVADVLGGLDSFDRQVLYKPKGKDPAQRGAAVLQALRDERLDAVVLFTNSLRTGWLAWRSGAAERIGYARDARGWLLTTRLAEPTKRGKRYPLPAIDSFLNLAYAAGGRWRSPAIRLATTDDDERAADDAWRTLGLAPGDNVVVLNTGGAYGDAKSWPAESFAALAQRIVGETNLSVVVNCGPSERETAARIADLAGSPRVKSLGVVEKLPIGLSKAVVRRARMLVTTDSGPRFFGVAFGKPVVTLFGPTDPRVTRTHYAGETTLTLGIGCQYCWERSCPLKHHACMKELSVERVWNATRQRLEASAPHVAAA
ncbi:MAG: glycosyltransferase family 9 protein [Lacipirellulaceae bacterium]